MNVGADLCRWGAKLDDSAYKMKYRLFFSEQVRGQRIDEGRRGGTRRGGWKRARAREGVVLFGAGARQEGRG